MELDSYLSRFPMASLPLQSRIHRLASYDNVGCQVYVKREDDLSFGVSGSKLRKFSSLIPTLRQQDFTCAVTIGGFFSNNLAGLAQILKQHEIEPIPFVLGPPPARMVGNGFLNALLMGNRPITWIAPERWPDVESLACRYAEKLSLMGFKTQVIPEGSSMPEALPGAMTLALDVIRHEHGFEHIFVDSGTGFSASALLLGLGLAGSATKVHVVELAGPRGSFITAINRWKAEAERLFQLQNFPTCTYQVWQPSVGRSFGSIKKPILTEIIHLAQREGLIADPIYSAKLFHTARSIISNAGLKGRILIIHSGGGTGLFGFQKHFQNLI